MPSLLEALILIGILSGAAVLSALHHRRRRPDNEPEITGKSALHDWRIGR